MSYFLSRFDGVEDNIDVRGLREGQNNLLNRVRRFKESIILHHVSESLNRIIRLEAGVGHGHVGESPRDCRVRMNQSEIGLTNLEHRVKAQDGHHDFSDQESSDETRGVDGRPRRAAPKRRTIAQARVPIGDLEQWFAQLQHDFRTMDWTTKSFTKE